MQFCTAGRTESSTDKWKVFRVGIQHVCFVCLKGKAEVLQVWDPVWIFLSPSKKPRIKVAFLFSCGRLNAFLFVGSTVLTLPYLRCLQTLACCPSSSSWGLPWGSSDCRLCLLAHICEISHNTAVLNVHSGFGRSSDSMPSTSEIFLRIGMSGDI